MSLSWRGCLSAQPRRDMRKGTVRNLSGSERLQIAYRRSGHAEVGSGGGSLFGKLAGVLVPSPAQPYQQKIRAYRRQAVRALARNSFERVVACLISPKKLLCMQNEAGRRFLFHCFFVPQFAVLETAVSTKLNLDPKDRLPPWWIFEPASYILAFERTFLEIILAGAKQGHVHVGGQTWNLPHQAHGHVDLPKPSMELLLEASAAAALWEARFDEWRASALQSFSYYMSLQSADITTRSDRGKLVSLWGAIEHLSPIPKELLAGIIEQLRREQANYLRVFYGAAAKLQPYRRAGEADLDSWLIEVHPLTIRLAWGHEDLMRIGRQKFRRRTGGLASPAHLRSHMRRLNLRLSPPASKPGIPKRRRRFSKRAARAQARAIQREPA